MPTKYQSGEQFTVDGKLYSTPSGSGYDAVLVDPMSTTSPTSTTSPIDASQTSDTTTIQQSQDLFKVPTSATGPGGEQIFDIFKGDQQLQEADFAKMGVNVADIPEGTAPTGFKSKFETGFDYAKTGGTFENLSDVQARTLIQQSVPPETQSNLKVDTFFQQDPFMTSLVKSFQDYISPVNQRKSLTETYQQMLKNSGVQALDTELINMKRIIESTEDSIREEIQKSGGFANENQILALSNARSKQLIKNYNVLLETRNAKEKYLSTMIGLEQQDRQEADARFDKAWNMTMQIADYGMKMQQQSIEKFDRIVKTIGWSGLLNSVDSNEARLIEQAYGLPAGGLQLAAQKELQAQALAQKPIEVSPGATLYDPITGEAIYTAPTTKQLSGSSLGGSRGGTDFGTITDPSRDTRIVDINGKPIKLTATQVDTLSGFETALQQLNEAKPLVGVVNTGPISGRMSDILRLFDKDDPNRISLDAKLNAIKANFLKAISGAAVSESEVKRLTKFLPSINDTEKTLAIKMTELENAILAQKASYLSTMGAQQPS